MQAIIVLFAVLVFTASNATVFATLGLFGRDIGLTEFEVGAIFSSSALLFFLTASFWGRLSDRLGRTRVMAAGLAATALSLGLFAALYATRWPYAFAGLLAARILYGLFAGGTQPAAVAWMVDATRRENRSAGIASIGAAASMGSILGPVLSAALVGHGLAWPVAVAGIAVALAAAAMVAGGETAPRPLQQMPEQTAPVDGLAGHMVLAFAMVLGFGALQPTTAFYVQDRFGLETADAIREAAFASASFAAGAFMIQAFGIRALSLPARDLMALGFVTCLAGLVGALIAHEPSVLILAFGFLGVGYGLAQAGLMTDAAGLGGTHRQGHVAGRLHAAMAAGWIAGALTGTALYALSIQAPLSIAGAALALCAVRTALPSGRTSSVPPP